MCVDEGADALGFIFYENSPRYIDSDDAVEIIRHLPSLIMKIGVFVNAPGPMVNRIAKKCRLNTVQLHGDESPEYIRLVNYPVIKAFRVNQAFDFRQTEAYKDHGILLDAHSRHAFGGTGKTFNWENIPKDLVDTCILAGGINSDNIGKIINEIRPAGIDLSSSLEKKPGEKDREKVRIFFNRLKDYM